MKFGRAWLGNSGRFIIGLGECYMAGDKGNYYLLKTMDWLKDAGED